MEIRAASKRRLGATPQTIERLKITATVISALAYIVVIISVLAQTGNPFMIASYIVVVLIASVSWGLQGGLIAAAAGVVANSVVLYLFHENRYLISATVQGALFYSLIGASVGIYRDTVRQLKQAKAQIHELTALLPICASCKKIRDDSGYWHQLEAYLSSHSIATFTHGLCPECLERSLDEVHGSPDNEKKIAR